MTCAASFQAPLWSFSQVLSFLILCQCSAGGSPAAEQPFWHFQPPSLPGLSRAALAEEGRITLETLKRSQEPFMKCH